jgi:hypothetical protein
MLHLTLCLGDVGAGLCQFATPCRARAAACVISCLLDRTLRSQPHSNTADCFVLICSISNTHCTAKITMWLCVTKRGHALRVERMTILNAIAC